MPYATNDTGQHIEFELQDLFGEQQDTNGKHPDYTGKARFIVPRSANGLVPHSDRLIYEPNFCNLGFPVIQYAGLEHCILGARSSAIASEQAPPSCEFEIFKRTDHLVVFLQQNRVHFKKTIGPDDVVLLPEMDHFTVSKRAVRIVRDFFETTIFPLFRYTTTSYMSIDWTDKLDISQLEQPPPRRVLMTAAEEKHAARRNDGFSIVVIFLEVEYLVIEPDAPRFGATLKPLGI